MKLKNKIAIGAALGVPALVYLGNNIFDFTKVEIENQNLKGLKIIHISDFHNRKLGLNKKNILKRIQEYDADFIFITGDLIDNTRTNLDIALDFVYDLQNFSDAHIYFVPGNHEKASGLYRELKVGLQNLGVHIGSYKGQDILWKGFPITIFGIKDPRFFFMDGYYLKEAIYKKKVREMSVDKDRYNILLAHRPEYLEEYSKKEFDLIFSGHAHGGQIRIPFLGGLLAPNQGFIPKLSEGVKIKNNSKMIISRGIGNSVFPIRIFNNPEIILVEFN